MKSSRRHAQIHLPPLDAGYALTLVDIFERAIEAIWRAHGHRMAELRDLRAARQEQRRPGPATAADMFGPIATRKQPSVIPVR